MLTQNASYETTQEGFGHFNTSDRQRALIAYRELEIALKERRDKEHVDTALRSAIQTSYLASYAVMGPRKGCPLFEERPETYRNILEVVVNLNMYKSTHEALDQLRGHLTPLGIELVRE